MEGMHTVRGRHGLQIDFTENPRKDGNSDLYNGD
jgi:hypothetical protein